MLKYCKRRDFIRQAIVLVASGYFCPKGLFANDLTSNFRYVYGNEALSREFYPFLINVFHLFPEKKLHHLINKTSKANRTDEEIYRQVQAELSKIKPFLGDLTYALPALAKQKGVMASQTQELLGNIKEINGYLEIGSSGRYLDSLEEVFDIEHISLMDEKEAGYGPIDIVERGQVCKAGEYINFNDYKIEKLKTNQYDLATMYIGMHHCPIELRNDFLQNIRDSLSRKGKFIIRDHDAKDEKMSKFVSLAHDVFNMGTMENWKYNRDERRNFYSLEALEKMMHTNGFKKVSGNLFQEGDPTKNALMCFKKS